MSIFDALRERKIERAGLKREQERILGETLYNGKRFFGATPRVDPVTKWETTVLPEVRMPNNILFDVVDDPLPTSSPVNALSASGVTSPRRFALPKFGLKPLK